MRNSGVTTAADWLSLLAGVVIVVATASSVIRTLVVTRGMSSTIVVWSSRLVRVAITSFAHRVNNYVRRDNILSWLASMTIVAMLAMWLLLFLLGYSLILFASSGLGWDSAVREAGSSLFTLGFASSDRTQLTIVDFVAAATGPIVIGLMISYLPTMYSAYNRRELDVALLKARAGEPNWGPELLARNTLVGSGNTLQELWGQWERWAADVSESHTTYATLIFTRSARPRRNWLVALLSVMDAAAMTLALNPHSPQAAPRVMLRQGVETMRDLAQVTKIKFDPDPDPDTAIQLTFEEFAEAVDMLDKVGYRRERNAADAWHYFRQWRLMYESIAYDLAMMIDAVPAKWSGPRKPPVAEIPPMRPRYVVNNPDGSLRFSEAHGLGGPGTPPGNVPPGQRQGPGN